MKEEQHKPIPQGPIFTEIVLEIFKLSGVLNAEGDRLTEEYGLSSARWKILGAIERSETACTVPQIARMMGQSRQAVQRLVDLMHRDGLLSLLDNPKHKRAKLVALTTTGLDIYKKLDVKQAPWASRCSNHLSTTELEATLSVLRGITHKLEV